MSHLTAYRINFSQADCTETSLSGRATSIRRFNTVRPFQFGLAQALTSALISSSFLSSTVTAR